MRRSRGWRKTSMSIPAVPSGGGGGLSSRMVSLIVGLSGRGTHKCSHVVGLVRALPSGLIASTVRLAEVVAAEASRKQMRAQSAKTKT